MSKLKEIERAVEQLPPLEFVRFVAWIDQRRQHLQIPRDSVDTSSTSVRDHSAFLSSYAPEDDGLYDDAPAR